MKKESTIHILPFVMNYPWGTIGTNSMMKIRVHFRCFMINPMKGWKYLKPTCSVFIDWNWSRFKSIDNEQSISNDTSGCLLFSSFILGLIRWRWACWQMQQLYHDKIRNHSEQLDWDVFRDSAFCLLEKFLTDRFSLSSNLWRISFTLCLVSPSLCPYPGRLWQMKVIIILMLRANSPMLYSRCQFMGPSVQALNWQNFVQGLRSLHALLWHRAVYP